MVRQWFITLLLILLTCQASLSGTADEEATYNFDEHQITILEPPVKPTIIDVGISLVQVIHIEAASVETPQITAQFKIRVEWQDHRLKAPTADIHKVHSYQDADAYDKLNRIFDPRITIVDGSTTLDHQHLRIYPNGTVNLSQVVTIKTPANMDLRHFPFDSQIFNFRFASSYWDDEEIDLILNPLETSMAPNAAPKSWGFDYAGYHITKSAVRSHSESFYVFSFMVHAQRDPRYFIWRLLLPLIVIVILSWNVFWMYEDSSSALGNCFVFLLTVVAFHQIANDMLPLIPTFTFLDSIVFISYGFIVIPTFQVMVTTKLENQGKREHAEIIRQYCRWFVPIGFTLTMLAATLAYFAVV
jgi:hypothetical protein